MGNGELFIWQLAKDSGRKKNIFLVFLHRNLEMQNLVINN
jgi:hypothetical protein